MAHAILTLQLLKGIYGVYKFDKNMPLPDWAMKGNFVSVTRTDDELSIVTEMVENTIEGECEGDWKVLKVMGPLDFALVGILSGISQVLAEAEISIFAISTYDTDYILLKSKNLDKGIVELHKANYNVERAE